MTVEEYIKGRFQTFGINLSEADIIGILTGRTDRTTDIDDKTINVANIAMCEYIPTLLLRATSINENGFSMSWNTDGIKALYRSLCNKYSLDDELSDAPKIDIL